MKYAIISSGGKQYKVSEGEEILFEKLNITSGKDIIFSEVLLISDGESVKVGVPFVNGANVSGTCVGEAKGEKIDVMRFKSKVHYRKKIGFRAQFSKVKINSISLKGSASPVVKTAPAKEPVPAGSTPKRQKKPSRSRTDGK